MHAYIRCLLLVIPMFTATSCTIAPPPEPRLVAHLDSLAAQNDRAPRGFGVVICGDNETRHIYSSRLAVAALQRKGFQYIFQLGVVERASKTNIDFVFAYLARMVNAQDVVWVHFSGHGRWSVFPRWQIPTPGIHGLIKFTPATRLQSGGAAGAVIEEGVITPHELTDYLSAIQPRFGVAVIGGCYSGRFAERLSRWIIMTSSKANERSYGEFEPAIYARMLASTNAEIGLWFDGAQGSCKHSHPQIVRGSGCEQNIVIPDFR